MSNLTYNTYVLFRLLLETIKEQKKKNRTFINQSSRIYFCTFSFYSGGIEICICKNKLKINYFIIPQQQKKKK